MLSEYHPKTGRVPLLTEIVRLKNNILKENQDRLNDRIVILQNPHHQKSFVNLNHYLALRKYDLRQIQDRLSNLGLSSLGACESHVMASLNKTISILGKNSHHLKKEEPVENIPSFQEGSVFLKENTTALFGEGQNYRDTRIMVTIPTEAATNHQLIDDLINAGMDTARINCAHDSPEIWKQIIDNVRSSAKSRGRSCKILMDLAGQKIRTGDISQQEGVIRIRARRNAYGLITRPTFVELLPVVQYQTNKKSSLNSYKHSIPVPDKLLKKLKHGDRIVFQDARNKTRQLSIHAQQDNNAWLASIEQSVYLVENIELTLQRKKNKKWINIAKYPVPPIGTQDVVIRLRIGDSFQLTYAQTPALPAQYNKNENIVKPAQICCTQPDAISKVQIGHTVWLDDGKLCAIVEAKNQEGLLLTVTHAPKKGLRLKGDKGINLPQTNLALPCLTEKDLDDLDFISQHTDIAGLSFVQNPEDILLLTDELSKRNAQHLPIIAKIETRQGIKNLPEIILQGLRQNSFGIMIARGDLSVEIGGERLAEIQEEVLWLCESAHIPVIWATQVLETLSKDGVKTRPEFTDAAMSVRAECVMLNKGGHVTQSVNTLDDIIVRMESHHYKKGARLCPINHWI